MFLPAFLLLLFPPESREDLPRGDNMDNLSRLKLRTEETDENLLLDLLETAKHAILARRFPYGDYPEDVEPRYVDLQFRIALSMYNKIGGEFEVSHSENGVSRSWGEAFVPEEMLSEITPKVSVR